MQPYPAAKSFGAKLIRFGQICLDLGKIWKKLRRKFGRNEAKFRQK